MTEARLLVDIGMCTFRRSELAEALASLDRLAVPGGVELHVCLLYTSPSPRDRG